MSQHPTDCKSKLAQVIMVMHWYHQTTRHKLSQCWPNSVVPSSFTRSQWVNRFMCWLVLTHWGLHSKVFVILFRNKSPVCILFKWNLKITKISFRFVLWHLFTSGIILCMRPANERRRNNVTPSLIGWAHLQNNPCYFAPDRCGSNFTTVFFTYISPYGVIRSPWIKSSLC